MYYTENYREIERISLSPHQARNLAQGLLTDPEIQTARRELTADAPLPEMIAGYKITRIIASGGMGTVYEARQEQPQRTVAIKVLKRHLASRSALRRFELEAELLGALQHPGIAHIYEAGTWDDGSGGVPYFVMEYIRDGRPITEYADAHELKIRWRLELFAQVCDAVHHGHQKGIIHRDLKPGNILVDASGQVKVIDFGVARSTDSDIAITTMHTEIGQIIGTLQYMSPEQCEGKVIDIDTRSDVYSLGVVLYELLCGKLPYDVSDTSLVGAARIIQEQEPAKPSMVQRCLRGDLESIVLKSLEKDTRKRYQSVAELARDCRQYLVGDPIDARPPSTAIRLLRAVRRHPHVTTAALCLTIVSATIFSTFISVWYLRKRPYTVVLQSDGRLAELISVTGHSLGSWIAPINYPIQFIHSIGDNTGDSDIESVVLGFHGNLTDERRGRVIAYDVNNTKRQLWSSRIVQEDLIDYFVKAGYNASDMGPGRSSVLADVFDDVPGPELIVAYGHTVNSAACIRVHDSRSGDILCEYWHDGLISSLFWHSESNAIWVVAHNSEALWHDRGVIDANHVTPIVVFAIRPNLGHHGNTIVSPSPGRSLETVLFYKCLSPPDDIDYFDNVRFELPIISPSSEAVRLVLEKTVGMRSFPGVGLEIDFNGDVIKESRLPNDTLRSDSSAPDYLKINLIKLPHIQRQIDNTNP